MGENLRARALSVGPKIPQNKSSAKPSKPLISSPIPKPASKGELAELLVVVDGTCNCNQGEKEAHIKVGKTTTTKFGKKPALTVSCTKMKEAEIFGVCKKLTKKKEAIEKRKGNPNWKKDSIVQCKGKYKPVPNKWQKPLTTVSSNGEAVIATYSELKCQHGGLITIGSDGQSGISEEDLEKLLKFLDDEHGFWEAGLKSGIFAMANFKKFLKEFKNPKGLHTILKIAKQLRKNGKISKKYAIELAKKYIKENPKKFGKANVIDKMLKKMGKEALDMPKFIGKKMKVLKQLPKKLLEAGKNGIMKPFDSSEYTKIFSKSAKGLDKLGSVFMVAGVTVSAHDNYKDLKDSGLKGTNYVSALATNTAVDVAVGSAITEVSMTIGGAIGTAIPIPVVGTIIGVAAGFGIGVLATYAVNNFKFLGNSVTGHIKDFVTNTYKTKQKIENGISKGIKEGLKKIFK